MNLTNLQFSSGILKSGGAVNNYVSGLLTTIMQTGRMDETLHVYRQEYEVGAEGREWECAIILTQNANIYDPI